MSDFDDLDDPNGEDQMIWDADAWAASQSLYQRWQGELRPPPIVTTGAYVQPGRHQFSMRLSDLADAITVLNLKKKPLPLRFELLPNCLRLSVRSEAGLVCRADAPLTSTGLIDNVCFELPQDLTLRLAALRRTSSAEVIACCEVNLAQRVWTITLPHQMPILGDAPRQRGRKRRTVLRFGIVVPQTRLIEPWEEELLEEGRPVDVAAIGQALACAHRLMSHQSTLRQPSGIDIAGGHALAWCRSGFYLVAGPALNGLTCRVAPADSVRVQRMLARMRPEARCHTTSTAEILTDGVLVCAIPRTAQPFPSLSRELTDLVYDEIELLQNREQPFFRMADLILPNREATLTASLFGFPGTYGAALVARAQKGCAQHCIEMYPPPLEATRSTDADESVSIDRPGALELTRHEVTICCEAAYRVLNHLPNGRFRLAFAGSRALLVQHNPGAMRATACFWNKIAPL